MRRATLFTLLFLTLPLTAFAQEEFEKNPKPSKSTDDKNAAKEPPKSEVQTGQTAEGRTVIRRGFFAEADLGMYLTFIGRNTADMTLPKRFSSNLEPHLGVNVGYDVVHSDAFNLAIALRGAMGFNGGLGRVSDAEYQTYTDPSAPKAGAPDPTTKPANYTVTELGLLVTASIMMTDRVAISVRGDGGLGVLNPDPTKAAATLDSPCPTAAGQTNGCNIPGAGGAAFVPVFGAGVGVEYYTLLNDFTVGVLLRFQGVLASDGMIPAASITFPIKYTF
jgi:hypothetical protein